MPEIFYLTAALYILGGVNLIKWISCVVDTKNITTRGKIIVILFFIFWPLVTISETITDLINKLYKVKIK